MGSLFLKPAYLVQVEEELATWTVLKNEEEFSITLERVFECNHERMPDRLKNSPFRQRVLDLVLTNDILLLQGLHRVELTCVLFANERHGSVRSFTDDRERFEVFLRQFFL